MSFNPNTTDWTRPATDGFAITPGAAALPHVTRGLLVGVSGNVTVTFIDGTSLTLPNLAAGVIHPLSVTHVTAATATGIIGLY